MNKYILILFAVVFFVYESAHAQTLTSPVTNNLTVDPTGVSDGTLTNPSGPWYGIRFGSTLSGEGIASPKTGSLNVNGLEFKTSYVTRFRLYNSGNAAFSNGNADYATFVPSSQSFGINVTPSAIFHVAGNVSNSASDYMIARFQTATVSSAYSYLNFGKSDYVGSNMFSLDAGTNTSGTVSGAHLLLLGSGNSGSYNLGIGAFQASAPPQSKLHVNGAIQVYATPPPSAVMPGKVGMVMGASINSSSTIASGYSWIQSSIGPLVLNPVSTNTLTGAQSNNYVAIGYTPNNAVSGGDGIANGYNLVVKGKILCEELKIKLKPTPSGAWPDYVFAPNYKLLSVDSLQSYITTNCHLPDVPSATEVEENGIMAGEMNGILLKKVEELTLYMIEQNKKSSHQETEIELLKKQNELLMQQVQLLMK